MTQEEIKAEFDKWYSEEVDRLNEMVANSSEPKSGLLGSRTPMDIGFLVEDLQMGLWESARRKWAELNGKPVDNPFGWGGNETIGTLWGTGNTDLNLAKKLWADPVSEFDKFPARLNFSHKSYWGKPSKDTYAIPDADDDMN